MTSAKSALILLGVSAFVTNLMIGCSASDDPVDLSDEDAGEEASVLPDTGRSDDGDSSVPLRDAGDSGMDAADSGDGKAAVSDAGPDADADADADANVGPIDTDAGAPGSPCAIQDEIQQQSCGFCGVQYRLCAADDSAPGSPTVWQPWGYCQNEVEDGCVPGTAGTEPCGLCGTRNRVCQIDCRWAVGVCKGQPANACSPGTTDFRLGLSCPVGGRERTCRNDCTFGSYGECAAKSMPTITLGSTVGAKATKQFTLSAANTQPKLTGTCGSSPSFDSSDTAYEYIKIVNPNANSALVSVWSHAPSGSGVIDSVMASYVDATAPPVTDAEREACTTGIVNCCSKPSGETDSTMCVGSLFCWAGLVGSDRITIAPNGTAVIYMAAYGSGTGDFMVSARVDALN
jgi:hypothetical protein